MRERWIQFSAVMMCGLMAGTDGPGVPASAPATKPAAVITPTTKPVPATHPAPAAPEKHEPVALPPMTVTPTQAPVAHPLAVTQPVIKPVAPVTPTAPPVGTTAPATPPPAAVNPTTQPGPIDEKLAYAIGWSLGKRSRELVYEEGRGANNMAVLKGFIDGLDDHDPAYSRQEVQAAFAEFFAATQQRRAEKLYADNPAFRKSADENLKKSRALLDQNAEMAQVDVRPNGIQVQELTPGTGRVVGNAKTLTVKDLRVSLADGTLVKTNEGDQTEKLTAADALPAVMNVMRSMRVGTRCRIWLPPEKAYGLAGKPPVIGPNEAIEYEFELSNAE